MVNNLFEMNMLWALILLTVGLVLLIKSADWLVDGSVNLAERFGISPIVIGLTIVAMGTSAPEAAASIVAALQNNGDVAIGNVYGSNIANLALIGGMCAIIRPIAVKLSVIRREIPVMLVSGLLLWPIFSNLHISRYESIFILSLFIGLIYFIVHMGILEAKTGRSEIAEYKEVLQEKTVGLKKSLAGSTVLILLGLAGLVLGANISVKSAVYIGGRAGLSDAVIGLSIVAIGTSLPELMTCIVASFKGQDDISIGNLVGSNIFNTLFVVGISGTVHSYNISDRLIGTDYWIMIVLSSVFLVLGILKKGISRKYGFMLLVFYLAYIAYILIVKKT